MLLATVSLDLRAATASDEPFLFALYASTRESELAAWGWAPAQRDAFLRMQWMAQSRDWAARHPRADHQVVCLQGQPVGRLLVAKAGEDALDLGEMSARAEEALARVFDVSYADYEGQVLAFLEPDEVSSRGSKEAWEAMQVQVASALERLGKGP